MVLSNKQHSLFVNAILIFIWIFLFLDIEENKVNAASFTTSGNAKESLNSCKSVCNDKGCHDEVERLKEMIDENVDPCHDFFNFACGRFLKTSVILSEDSQYNLFDKHQYLIDTEAHNALKEFNSNSPKSFVMMKNFYDSCVKQEEDMNAILNILKNIGFPALLGDTWDESAYDWKEALFKIIDEGIQMSFPIVITTLQDRLHGSNLKNIPQVNNAETTINKNFKDNDILKYQNYIIGTLLALGASEDISKRDAEQLTNFEIALNNIMTTPPPMNLMIMSLDTMPKNPTSIPWQKLFDRMSKRHGVSINSSYPILLTDVNFLNQVEVLIEQTPKRTIANYIAWSLVRKIYRYLPKEFGQLTRNYNGIEVNRPGLCYEEVKKSFSIALDALYVNKYALRIPKEIETIVQNIKNQMEISMKEAKWMDDVTRKAALKKIREMNVLIGYSKELLDLDKVDEYYSKVELTSKCFLKSYIALSELEHGNELTSWYDFNNSISWTRRRPSFLTLTPNHQYASNRVVLSAEPLRNLWYAAGRPNYLNYGTLGSLLGHEMYHGFDNRGRFYNENGLYGNWWSNDTDRKYSERSQCLIEQFDNFEFLDLNLTVNGVQTLNENIADNGGFIAAYYAYIRWIEENGITEQCLPSMNYTPKQLFWISSALNWCAKEGSDWIKNLIQNDPHPPNHARVLLTYSNYKEFAEDFKCEPDFQMNREKKCRLW